MTTRDELFAMARAAAARAHAPYSDFPVGAAILTTEGRIHPGCNVENVAFPLGTCAEAGAIAAMVMAGGSTRIAEIAVHAPRKADCTPCGGCRQRLAEFGGPDTLVHLTDAAGVTRSVRLAELLPLGFVMDAPDGSLRGDAAAGDGTRADARTPDDHDGDGDGGGGGGDGGGGGE